jgi:hypothetical protein
MSQFSKNFRRALVLGGVSSLALASQAHAATAQAPFDLSYRAQGSTCIVDFNATITGTTVDASFGDSVAFGAADAAGNRLNTVRSDFAPINQTVTRTTSGQIEPQNSGSSAPFMAVFEVTGTSTVGGVLAQTQVDLAQMAAAGGSCITAAQRFGFSANNPPVANAGPDFTAQDGTVAALDGSSSSDPDGAIASYSWNQVGGQSVTLSDPNAASPTFTVPFAAGPQTLRFELVVTDNGGAQSSDFVEVSVPAPSTNQAPVADAGPDQNVARISTAQLDGSGSSDPDGDPLTYSWAQTSGPTVTLNGANPATPSFTVPNVDRPGATFVFELTTSDPSGAVSTDTVSIVVNANQAPIPDAGPDQTVQGSSTVTLDGSGTTDPDGDPVTYTWTQFAGPTVTLSDRNSVNPTFVAPQATSTPQVLEFRLRPNDGVPNDPNALQPIDTVTITIPATTTNGAPVANAGPDQTVSPRSTVQLDATSSSDPDGDPLTYAWTQTGGNGITLSDASSATPTFTAPAARRGIDNVFTFEVTVSDPSGASTTDTVQITIPRNDEPTADAGQDQTAPGGSTVTLDASGSTDPEGDPLTYSWTQRSGPGVTLSDPSVAMPTFTAPAATAVDQTLVFRVTISDGNPSPFAIFDQVTVTIPAVVPVNTPPVADAGADATIAAGASVALDGSGSSDADNDPLSASWTQVSGPPVTIANANGLQATFTAPAQTNAVQTLVFELSVNDDNATSSDRVTFTVPANGAPTANAGPDRTVLGGQTVNFDFSQSSDPGGDPLTYSFVQVSGPQATIVSAVGAAASIEAPATTASAQTLVFELTVNDGTSSATDTVTVTVEANRAPVADAGPDQTVEGGTVVILDGTGSSDEGQFTYRWTQTGGPTVTLDNANLARPRFTAPAGQANATPITFELTIDDGVATATDTVVVTVEANTAPIADAGADQGPIDSGRTVTLNGTGSRDPEGAALTYRWTQVSGPSVTLSNASSAQPTFTAPDVNGQGSLVFELVVNDGQVDSPADRVTIAVRGVGTITIVQQVIGADTTVGYTSTVPGLPASATTSGGTASITATDVAAGGYSFSVDDLRAQGYALTALACDDADSTVSLANGSIALALSPSEDLVCTVTLTNSRSAAQQAIGEFIGGRNALLLANQPDLQRRLGRLRGSQQASGSARVGQLPVPGSQYLPARIEIDRVSKSVTSSLAMAKQAMGLGGSERTRLDVWAEASVSDVTIGRNRGTFALGYLGFDYLVTDEVLLGALVQIDDFDNEASGLGAGLAEGDGWMAGPYVTARLSDRFYVDLRAAYGRADNSVSPLGTYVSAFDSERFLISGSAIGDVPLGNGFGIWPEIGVRYISEDVMDYVDALGVAIPGAKIDQGEVAFSPRLDYRKRFESGWSIAPYAEFEGLLTFGSDAFSAVEDGLRGRLMLGIDGSAPAGLRFGVNGFYDGIGEDDLEALGASVTVSFGF